jgi:hypothetical protein
VPRRLTRVAAVDFDLKQGGAQMRVQLRVWAAVVFAVLAGCSSSSVREIYLPDGSKGYNISCDGGISNTADCFQQAGDICGAKGYNNVTSQVGMAVTRALFIRCKE